MFKPLNILILICKHQQPAVVLASIAPCGSCSQYSICIRSQLGSPIISELPIVPSITVCALSVVFVAAATVEFLLCLHPFVVPFVDVLIRR